MRPDTQLLANGPCSKCGGKGWYAYDHNHSKPCEVCCTHPGGWWPLTEHHAHGVGYEACKDPGCGAVRKIGSDEVLEPRYSNPRSPFGI